VTRMKKWVLSLGLLAILLPTQNAEAAAPNDIPQIKAGRDFSIARQTDGTVWAWGSNSNGQLGDGTTNNIMEPAEVADLSGVTSVAAGEYHSLALKKDGTVWAWGSNSNGQVGDGTAIDRLKPVQVKKLDHVIAIEAGGSHSVAIKENGTVWVWGKNGTGQLGDGTTANRSLPIQVEGIDHAKAAAAGMFHTVVLKDDGTVWAWGYNADGQIGNGTYHSTTVPVQVKGLANVIAIASGGSHSFALNEDGSVWVWGRNADGQLGDGTLNSKDHPIMVEGITKAVSIGAGRDFGFAIIQDGTVWGWGSNYVGQLGLGTSKIYKQKSPMKVENLTDTAAIDGGELHAVVLKKDGTVWGMGKNAHGQLGNGGGKEVFGPIQVNDLNVGKTQASSTPTPTPTPAPTPAPANPLTVKGGVNTISVENGSSGSTITLMLKTPHQTVTKDYLMFLPKSEGKGTFYGLPAGTEYYVFNEAGETFGPITVTDEENSKLFNLSKTTASATFDPSTKMYTIKVSGEVQSSVTKVRVRGYEEDVPVTNNKFSISFTADPIRTFTYATLSAYTADGTRGNIFIELQRDFVNDLTVEATKLDNNGTLLIKGTYAADKNKEGLETFFWDMITGELTYLQDRRLIGKAAPRSKEEADLKQSMVDFEYQITTERDRFDFLFFVKNDQGEFELVRPMKGLGTPSSTAPITDIYMQMDSTRAIVTGKEYKLEVAPFYQNGRAMVPIRFIAEAMGATVGWDNQDHSVTLTRGDIQIKLLVDKKEAYVNGRLSLLDAPPTIKEDVTMVPLRFISESLNLEVQFDEGNIQIKSKK